MNRRAMKISVATISAPEGVVTLQTVELPEGAVVRDAAVLAGLDPARIPAWGVCGRKASPETALFDGDRVDAGAPLLVDPMTARRLRAQHKDSPAPRPRHGSIHQLIKPLET